MKIMLDTATCIYLIKDHPKRVRKRLRSQFENQICLSSIVISELWFGVYKSQRVQQNEITLSHFLNPFIELEYGCKAVKIYGELRARLQKSGRFIGSLDTLIAAHVIAEDAVLVTNNTKEFSRIDGLRTENWT